MFISESTLNYISSVFSLLVLLLSYGNVTFSKGSLVPEIASAAYQVSLQRYGSHLCSGALISPEWVITSARCTNQLDLSNLRIRAGSLDRTAGGVVIKVSKIVQHPEYDSEKFDYDFSLLQLETWNSDGITYGTVKLPENDAEIDGVKLVVTEWGSVLFASSTEHLLHTKSVVTVDQNVCNEIYSKLESDVTDRMICAGVENNDDDCQRDIGSPLVINEAIIGVSSWGYGCTIREYPDVYSRIFSVRDWIRDVTRVRHLG